MRIILASRSAGRKLDLDLLGLEYEVVPSDFDEKSLRHDDPRELARQLSEAKACAVGDKEQGLIISGDIFVVFKGKVYEKPRDESEAYEMLKSFSGQWLDIVSGVAVFNSENGQKESAVEEYSVKFRELKECEIRSYIKRYPVTHFAAAFDGDGQQLFAEQYKGEYPFSTAFPMPKLILLLRKHGIEV